MAILACFWVLGCESIVTDLPETDTTKFISGNTVTFPKGTRAIDVYNTVISIYSDNDLHDVNGNWQRIRTTTTDGLTNQTWQAVSFNRIKHDYSKHESGVNTHTVYLYNNDTLSKSIVYEWQRQTTNVWKNEAIEGDITFTF